jgi:homogentisate 1,2-dioxygenase
MIVALHLTCRIMRSIHSIMTSVLSSSNTSTYCMHCALQAMQTTMGRHAAHFLQRGYQRIHSSSSCGSCCSSSFTAHRSSSSSSCLYSSAAHQHGQQQQQQQQQHISTAAAVLSMSLHTQQQYTPLSLLRNCLQPHDRAQLGALHMSSTATSADTDTATRSSSTGRAFAHTPESKAKISAGNKVY